MIRFKFQSYISNAVSIDGLKSTGGEGHGQDSLGDVSHIQVECVVIESIPLTAYYLSQPVHFIFY